MNQETLKTLNSQDWKTIMTKLYAHAIFRLNWFGIKSETRLQGREAKDFAHQAVTLVYGGDRNWDPMKEPDLVKYLKQVVNSLISNLLKSEENKRATAADLTDEVNDGSLFDNMFEQKLIGDDLREKIEDTLADDSDMWLVFTSLAVGMTPLDIFKKYGTEIEKIRNLQKKLRRHINNIKNL